MNALMGTKAKFDSSQRDFSWPSRCRHSLLRWLETGLDPEHSPAKLPEVDSIHQEEEFEDPLPQLQRNAGSLVSHGDDYLWFIQLCTELDLSASPVHILPHFHQIEQCQAE